MGNSRPVSSEAYWWQRFDRPAPGRRVAELLVVQSRPSPYQACPALFALSWRLLPLHSPLVRPNGALYAKANLYLLGEEASSFGHSATNAGEGCPR